MKRGALIVIEGIDRTGKSTQSKTLVENLQKNHIKAHYMNFPNRQSDTGKVINSYLTSKKDLSDEVVHLLFSANRWESAGEMIRMLENGTTLIVDRYCYSGVAFSAAKGLDFEWCRTPDIGLPRPDKVFFLTIPMHILEQRNGFGNERYEKIDFQNKVADVYADLKENNWEILDANRSIAEIQDNLLKSSLETIKLIGSNKIGKLWV